MSSEVQCPGCAARFRIRVGPGAPLQADLPCPRCGVAIAMRRESPTLNMKKPVISKNVEPRAGWQAIDRSAVFGRSAPPPPVSHKTKSPAPETSRFAEPTRPKLGLFGGSKEDIDPSRQPRLPEADRPDPVRPLASALLKELKQRRTGTEPVPGDRNSEPQALVESTPSAGRDFTSSTAKTNPRLRIPEPTDEWLTDELIEEAVDAASEELYVVDDSPMPFDRLPGAYDDGNFGPRGATVEVDMKALLKKGAKEPPSLPEEAALLPEPEEQVERAEPEKHVEHDEELSPEPDEQELQTEVETPDTGSEPAPEPAAVASAPKPDSLPEPQVTYRLRINGKVYGGIEFKGLMELFRRGIWVVADQIAEDNGEWMPIEDHPIFDRVRHAIADGLTSILLNHAQLIEESPQDSEIARTPPPAATPEIHSAAIETAPASAPAETIPSIRAASSTLPWTIALVTTGVASASLMYAFMSAPLYQDDSNDQPRAEVIAPVVDESAAVTRTNKLENHRRTSEAMGYAADLIREAVDINDADLAEEAIRQGDFHRARKIAADHYASTSNRGRLQEVFDRAVAEDPFLRPALQTIEPDLHGDTLRALGGGASVTLRITDGGENRYALKLDRDEWEGGWRVEVAAYLLCEILPCGFDIPINEPARISREDFDELYGRVNTPRQNSYAERFDELIWHEEEGPDGAQREYVYGTLKEWIPNYVNVPIEYVETWEKWLDISQEESVLDENFDEYLARIRPYQNGRFARRVAQEYHEDSAHQMARQISNLSVFDYLSGNFDRYSGIEDYYGVNSHFADGRFVAIDNSAAFQFRSLNRMEPRLARLQRFSRTMIDGVRLLNPETINPVLFPEADGREAVRLRTFWIQRDKLLDHVDALVEEHGEEAVYAFE